MASFVLIHGAWHGGWCWERVLPLLDAKGHRAVAPDSPGMGDDRTPFDADVLGQWVHAAAAAVERQPGPVVLVGHSRGAVVASALAERIPGRLAQVIYLAGYTLADGEALMDVRAGSDDVYAAVRPAADGSAVSIDPAAAARLFFGLSTPEVAARAAARLCPEPLQPAGARLTLSDDRYGRVPRSYIETSEDRALPLALQREARSRWRFDRVLTLPSDHSPFLSMPERLADALDDLVCQR